MMTDREMTPSLAQNIHMSVHAAELEELKVAPDKAKYYRDGIKLLAPQLGSKAPRLAALLDKLGESINISLFVMPADPWPIPATFYFQDRAGFGLYFDLVTDEFKVVHSIFGNGIKYSLCEEDDKDLTIFLERKSPAKQNDP